MKKILKEKDAAIKRYTAKLKEENKCRIQVNKKVTGLKKK